MSWWKDVILKRSVFTTAMVQQRYHLRHNHVVIPIYTADWNPIKGFCIELKNRTENVQLHRLLWGSIVPWINELRGNFVQKVGNVISISWQFRDLAQFRPCLAVHYYLRILHAWVSSFQCLQALLKCVVFIPCCTPNTVSVPIVPVGIACLIHASSLFASILVPMGLLMVVLFMVMASSSVALPAQKVQLTAVNEYGRQHDSNTDQHDSLRKQSGKTNRFVMELVNIWISQLNSQLDFCNFDKHLQLL